MLEKLIFSHISTESKKIIYGPKAGVDAAIIKSGDNYFVCAVDPCISVPEEFFGYLAFHFCASDVAVVGGVPEYAMVDLLLPHEFSEKKIEDIMASFINECEKYNVFLVGGHTGFYRGITQPVASVSVFGRLNKYGRITTSDRAKPGDFVIQVKPAAKETVAMIQYNSWDKESLTGYFGDLSCLEEALTAHKIPVNAMHDATEGGIITALEEISANSRVRIELDRIYIDKVDEQILREKDIDVFSASSTGVLFITVASEYVDDILSSLKNACVVGKVKEGRGVYYNGKRVIQGRDPYEKIASGVI